MDNVIVWGSGDIANRLLSLKQDYRIIVYVDSNPDKWGKTFEKNLLFLQIK